MEHKFCQSCGMPLTTDNKGTNADGSRNEDYCIIAQDPFNINGIADYRIVEFTPTMFVESSLSDILK